MMNKIPFILLLFISNLSFCQTALSPAMVNNGGGSGVVTGTYYDYTVGEPITLFGGTSCDSIFSGFQHCAIDTLHIKQFNVGVGGVGNTTICQTTSVVLSAQAGSTYTWSNGAHTQSISVGITGVYTASVTNNCGNTINSNPITITVVSPSTPNICMVTVDSLSINNEIYWEKSLYNNVDSFIVYREVSANLYKRIGAVSKNAYSMYTDTNRSIGPNKGDPNFTSYKYKLQIRDTCGNYGVKSLWHQTLFIQDQQNGNFNWNSYAIESSSTSVNNYNLKRRDLATGTETLVGSTSSNLFTDPQYGSVWNTNIKWLVDAVGFNCNPTLKLNPNNTLAQKIKTKSNHANDKSLPTKVKDITSIIIEGLKLYPNPAKDMLTIEINKIDEAVGIELNDLLGQTLTKINTVESINTINTSNYMSGIYFLNITLNNKTVAVRKVIIE